MRQRKELVQFFVQLFRTIGAIDPSVFTFANEGRACLSIRASMTGMPACNASLTTRPHSSAMVGNMETPLLDMISQRFS